MQGRSTRNRCAGVGSLSILALTLYACGADSGVSPEDPEPEQHQVDAGGATLSAQGGNVSLTVPPGAVPAATTITVTPVSEEPADPDLVPGTMYDFGPDGLQFAEPVTLRLAYDPAAIPGQASAAELRIFKRSGTNWLPTARGSVDVAAATVTGEISGFSQFAVVVAEFETLVIMTTSLPFGVIDVDYWEVNGDGDGPPHLMATGGDGANVWTVIQGEMPTGLSLQRDGIIVGTPTVVGTQNLTIEVANGVDQTAQRTFSFAVNTRPVLAPSELCTDYPGYAVATFEDATLEAAVRARMLLAADDEITCTRASTFGAVDVSDSGITSLVGMQNMPGMRYLDLSFNTISDISPLSGMVILLSLELNSNAITDVGPLSGLTALTGLYLHDNSIVDVGALSQMTSLESLNLKNNTITDVGALAGMTSLNSLIAENNSISNVTPLGGLTSLVSLWLDNNAITGISPLRTLTGLVQLRLAGNSIGGGTDGGFGPSSFRSSLAAVSGMTGLEWLTLDGSPLGGIDPLLNFQPLLDNLGLDSGDVVDLLDTGVHCNIVDALRARGVMVGSKFPPNGACVPE